MHPALSPLLTVCTAFPCPGLRADTRSPCHTGASVQTVTFTVFTTYAHTLNAILCLSHVHITHNKHNYAHVCVTHHTCTHACTHTRTHTHTHTHTYIYTWCECILVTCTKGKGFVCSVGTVHETVAHHVQGQGNRRLAVAVEQMHLEEDAILITLDHNCSVSGGEGGGTEMLGRNASTHQNTSMYTDNQTASSPPLPHSDRRKRSGSGPRVIHRASSSSASVRGISSAHGSRALPNMYCGCPPRWGRRRSRYRAPPG